MTKNEDGTFIYLIVPYKYNCIYKKLLIKMSDLGIDIIKDCNTTCKGINREVINCWNMFNAACSAYTLGYGKEANLMINYINNSLSFGCEDQPIDEFPYIINFKLNIDQTIIGAKSVKYNSAEFTVGNKSEAERNSLTIYQVIGSTNTIIASGLPLDSPVNFNETTLNAQQGQTYRWTASVVGKDGKTYFAEDQFEVVCVAPPKTATMYYGHTDIEPQVFEKMSINDIMALPGNTPRTITGSSQTKFVIHQEKHIHYLLIPSNMELVWAEFGTVLITTLWDGTGNNAAYRTNNPGGTFNGITYKVYFFYAPIIFDEDIRITVRNK